ncbi:MAG: DNA internalization-related competence protein ComEC/Rec2 [Polyangiaceae bacterium]
MRPPRQWTITTVIACALALGSSAVQAPFAAGAVLVGLSCSLRARPSWVLIAWVAAALTLARAERRLDEARRDYAATREGLSEPTRCELSAEVLASPVVLRRAEREPGQDARLDLRIDDARCEGAARVPPGTVARIYGGDEAVRRGDRVLVVTSLAPVRLFANPERGDGRSGDPHTRIALSGITASGTAVYVERLVPGAGPGAWVDAARAHVRARIEATFAPPLAPYGRALVLGETDLVDLEREAFRRSGLAHLLAVSGTHLILAVLAFVAGLRGLLVRIPALAARGDVARLAAGVGIVAAWAYADFAGGGGSAYRAAAMMSAALAARMLLRRPSGPRSFVWSLAGGVVVEPLAVHDLSFLLSVAATGGLLGAAPALRRAAEGRGGLGKLLLPTVGATLAATLACAPVLLGVGPELPLLGIAANVMAAPFGELIALPTCFAHALLGFWPAAEQGAAAVASGALAVVRGIALSASASPAAALSLPSPTAGQLAALALAVLACLEAPAFRRRLVVAALLVVVGLELVARREGAPEGVLRVTVLDVGQGDSLVVDLPDGRLMVIDGGGLVGSPVDTGARALLPLLRARRRSFVDIAVMSHPHPDHYTGLLTLLERVPVGELWIPGIVRLGEGQLGVAFAAAAARGVRVRTAVDLCGAEERAGEGRIEVLAPCPRVRPGRSANDNSLVLRLTLGERAALLTGDAEREEEQELLAAGRPLAADLLKVGHHGSRTSTSPAFAAAVGPTVAVMSCGVRNRFGHPHRPTVETLEGLGIERRRTDRGGALIWQTDGRIAAWGQPAAGRDQRQRD